MRPRDWNGWRIATAAAVLAWLPLVASLMVFDVWDETNGILLFGDAGTSLLAKERVALTEPLGFWRPLPTAFLALALHAVRDPAVAFRLLRAANAALLLVALWLWVRQAAASRRAEDEGASGGEAPTGTEPDEPRVVDWQLAFLLTVAFLYSGSALITAGWFATVYDASALVCLAAGTGLLLRGRAVPAGLVFGLGFFCKETAALALPFVVCLWALGRVDRRRAAICAGVTAALGLAYFALRSRVIELGSATDVHGFDPDRLGPTVIGLAESFWRQTLKGTGPGVLGFVWLGVSLAALRRPRAIGAALGLLSATALVYWGMLGEYQDGLRIHHLNFVGRLYLVPVSLLLFLLALERRRVALAVLCLPILYGGATTWRDHRAFQRTYAHVYEMASERVGRESPLLVDYPPKPLHDTLRGVEIGDLPHPMARIDARTGDVARLALPKP